MTSKVSWNNQEAGDNICKTGVGSNYPPVFGLDCGTIFGNDSRLLWSSDDPGWTPYYIDVKYSNNLWGGGGDSGATMFYGQAFKGLMVEAAYPHSDEAWWSAPNHIESDLNVTFCLNDGCT